ncbi:hypothetical protein CTI12_AA606450 [Artemisia annua]|uniref:Mitochondrial inner membrane translocase subunit Tim17/Tim22/Tim23/peroxisomal protein PMP24 n=1 Tax=Artemisia annua TaxID=35608 RepID=A0A2U1KGD0_ARTAN|nr:hypothetical protein CTI12_AA606450 [Artemisia annua]
MEKGNGWVNENPITKLVGKRIRNETSYNKWLAEQSLPVEVSVVTATSTVSYAALSGLFDLLVDKFRLVDKLSQQKERDIILKHAPTGFRPFLLSYFSGSPLITARNFGLFFGLRDGVSCVMKRLGGQEDVSTSMVAGFGSGVVLSLVTGTRGPPIIPIGVCCGLFSVAIYKVTMLLLPSPFVEKSILRPLEQAFTENHMKEEEKSTKLLVEDVSYNETRDILFGLCLDENEKNVTGDKTLSLLTKRENEVKKD